MKHLRFSFDLVSRESFEAFERLPQVLKGVSYEVSYEPVLLASHSDAALALTRLLVATAPAACTPNRWACELVLRQLWQGTEQKLSPARDSSSDDVSRQLEAATAEASARGVTATPSIEVDGQIFGGLLGLDLLTKHLHG